MKRLILLRHAEAVSKRSDDFGRVLSPRGRRQMESVAKHLSDAGLTPDLALVSSSARTRETWELARLSEVEARFDRRIYEAEAGDLLAILHGVSAEAGSVLMVGHNPSFEGLARSLAGSGEEGDLARLASEYPTACVAVIDFDTEGWSAIAPGGGRLVSFITPDGS